MRDKIKVKVTFTTQAVYSKVVEMTPKEYGFYCDEIDRARIDRETSERAQDLFDEFEFELANPTDWDDPELDTFEEMRS